jgi:hypothetical protein
MEGEAMAEKYMAPSPGHFRFMSMRRAIEKNKNAHPTNEAYSRRRIHAIYHL